jgi:hypothetical protein
VIEYHADIDTLTDTRRLLLAAFWGVVDKETTNALLNIYLKERKVVMENQPAEFAAWVSNTFETGTDIDDIMDKIRTDWSEDGENSAV